MTKKFTRLKEKIAKAEADLARAVNIEQQTCTHKNLGECDYQSLNFCSVPPLRVCMDCGMTEDGWGPGYVVLEGDAVQMSRDDVYHLRQGLFIGDHHKGPLLRGETTVAQLLSALEQS